MEHGVETAYAKPRHPFRSLLVAMMTMRPMGVQTKSGKGFHRTKISPHLGLRKKKGLFMFS